MQPSTNQVWGRVGVVALVAAATAVPLRAYAAGDMLSFNYSNLTGSFSNSNFFAQTVAPTSSGNTTRLDGGSVAANFDFANPSIGFAATYISLHISSITATTAVGTGSLTLTDIDGDEFLASVSGNWALVGSSAVFTGALTNVQPFLCAGDAIFEGTSGSFSMAFSEPSPFSGQMSATVELGSASNWFSNGPFSSKPTSTSGQVVAGGTGTSSPQVQITVWRSVRTHAIAGAVALRLDAAASGNGSAGPAVEPRTGGIQKIEVMFDGPITLTSTPTAGISVVGRTTQYVGKTAVLGPPVGYPVSSVALVGTNTLAINFNAGLLPDDSCYSITIGSGVINQTINGDRDCNVRSQFGDTNGDGLVNLSDAVAAVARSSTCITDGPRFDLNLSGTINLSDALAAKSRIASPAHQALCP